MTQALTGTTHLLKRVLLSLLALGVLLLFMRLVWLVLDSTPLSMNLRRDLERIAEISPVEQKVRLALVGEGFKRITDIQFFPAATAQPGRLAIVLQKEGTARLWSAPNSEQAVNPGAVLFETKVQTDSEMGLLGLAFHPDVQSNGLFYTNCIPAQGARRTQIAEWRLQAGTPPGGAAVQRVLLEVPQPAPNHNAGALAFGPDRMLYIPLGDGGGGGDPKGHAQNPHSLLGKILRIDPTPTGALPYGIPPGNLLAPQFLPEIWAYGLRNPWRASFTPRGELIVGDVGQGTFEEVDWVRAGDNLGWNIREAGSCFDSNPGCVRSGFVDPIFAYDHVQGNSITGGYVYLGNALPELRGKYIFADFGSGRVWALPLPEERGGAYPIAELLGQWPIRPSTFGQDNDGELYIADYDGGKIYRFAPL